MAITTAMADSFKVELMTATHNFTNGQHTFKMALFANTSKVAGNTYNNTATSFASIASGDEASGTGYTLGGTAMTNVTPTNTGNVAFTNWSPNPQWTSASFTTCGCMIYNNTSSNRCVAVYSFGGDQTVTSGTLTVQMPTAAAATAVVRLA